MVVVFLTTDVSNSQQWLFSAIIQGKDIFALTL